MVVIKRNVMFRCCFFPFICRHRATFLWCDDDCSWAEQAFGSSRVGPMLAGLLFNKRLVSSLLSLLNSLLGRERMFVYKWP